MSHVEYVRAADQLAEVVGLHPGNLHATARRPARSLARRWVVRRECALIIHRHWQLLHICSSSWPSTYFVPADDAAYLHQRRLVVLVLACLGTGRRAWLCAFDATLRCVELMRNQLVLQLVEQLLLTLQLQLELLLLVEHFKGGRLMGYLVAEILHHVGPGVPALVANDR